MSERMVKCQACGELVPHWAVYGGIGEAFCADCYSDMVDAENGFEEWYGMAPHHHDLSRTGGWIGSTVIDPLPAKCDEHGWYDLGNGTFFLPDKEVGGAQGIWRRYPNTYEKPTAPPFELPDQDSEDAS